MKGVFCFIGILFYGVFITINPRAFALGFIVFISSASIAFDFLLYHFEVSLEFLNLTVHFFYQAVALLASRIEETEVVLVGSNLAAQLVVAAQEFATLIVECIAAFLGNILQVVLEVVEVALCVGGVKFS